MAEGLPTPKSREQILSEMLTEFVGLTGVDDLNTSSIMTQFFDVVSRSVARTSGDIFQVLRDFSVDRATGEALNRIGEEERIPRNISRVANGRITIIDTNFEKITTKIYAGSSAPNIGSVTIRVADASKFPATGVIYIGRGTPNIEGPISYNTITPVGSFWEVTLDSPTQKFHNISESVIVGQGGTRNIPANTAVLSPGVGATADILFNVSTSALLLDGENINNNVRITAQEPGSFGNAPAGAIREFIIEPFPGASVINNIPISNGSDQETDDDYRDRIKKERLSRGFGTSLAVKNTVLGAQAPDENERVVSNEIDTSNPDRTILYIDNGEGYEEKTEGVGFEAIIESAIGGEQSFQLATGGAQTSVAKAFLKSSLSIPFDIKGLDRLAILVGGIVSEHIFGEGDFQADGAATAFEIVASINDNPDLTFEASTSNSGTKVIIRAKAENDEFLKLTAPSSGTDAAPALGFQLNEVQTVLLYKNAELLNKNGRSAFILSKTNAEWNTSIQDGDTLIVEVDGTDPLVFTFNDADFIEEGQHSTVSSQNSLSSWANVINAKITGVTAEINGEQLKLTSNLGAIDRASLVVDPASDLVAKAMFSSDLGLSAKGNEADFELSRNTAQIKLKQPLSEGDSLTLGSELTRAEVRGTPILGGQTTISDTAYVWLSVDAPTTPINVGLTADTFINVLKPGSNIVRYNSTAPNAFSNVQVGDYVVVWSNELSASNRLEGRVNAVTATDLDIKVTGAEEAAAVAEGPILFNEGFTVIRSEFVPQKLKLDAGIYDVNAIAVVFNNQLQNAATIIKGDEVIIFRTNTEAEDGSIFVVDFNDPAKSLNLIKNSSSVSINSQAAFYETRVTDKQFPAFVHGTINTEAFADPPTSFINTIDSSEDLGALGVDPSGFACLTHPYGGQNDVSSKECVDINNYTGSVINVSDSPFYKRSRVNDRYYVLNGYDFGHDDTIVAILDNDSVGKTFEIPLYRTAITNITLPPNANNFRAYDLEGGPTTEFTEFFGSEFLFNNYKALMKAKNVIDPLSLTNEDAILFRSTEWGRSGEKFKVGYFYPTTSDQGIQHVITVNSDVDIKIFLKSGSDRVTTADGTTEWNITITPLNPQSELITYTHSGTGSAPGLGSVVAGDYVSIIGTGEFNKANTGSYRVESNTVNSFTIKRAIGEAIVESNISSLESNTVSIFESLDTTAQEIVDYTTSNISDYITAEIIDDNGTSGAGIINKSTLDDSDFAYSLVSLLDGKNYILSTDLDAAVLTPQFVFKESLDLPTFSTNTSNAYSFNKGEEIRIVPITSLHVTELLNILAVTGFTTLGEVKSVDRNTNVQLSTNVLGGDGAIFISGGTGSSSVASIEGNANIIGDQGDPSAAISIFSTASSGFHSDQWVKVAASEVQKKLINVSSLNSIQITSATPAAGSSKIDLFDRTIAQRFFGRNRYHTRTRGRTFRVEEQGQFACISWDNNGTEPFFLNNSVDVKDSSSSTITIFKNQIAGSVDINVDTGDMLFDEVAIGDVVTFSNRVQEENNGNFIVAGISPDHKTLRIANPNGINELASGSFTVTDNVAVLTSSFTVGGTVLVEGVDFVAGIDTIETASNLSAAISAIPGVSSSSSGSDANITSDSPGIVIGISVSGGGATASDTQLNAPISNTGDVAVVSEVQEGDSVTITDDFNVLNRGIFRIIRRFNNSIYIDNSNTVEEEITLADHLVATGADGTTGYDLDKLDGINRLRWDGTGTEPSLNDLKTGDIVTLGTDFAANNQGEFHVVDSGEKLTEITELTMSRAVDMATGQYFLINSADDATAYYVWYNIDGGGGDPAPGGTGIEVNIAGVDLADVVATATETEINTFFSADFTASTNEDILIVETTGLGPTTNATNGDITGPFSVEVIQQGRKTFVDYINVNGTSETGITIADVLEFHRESMQFKEYEGIIPGDIFVITSDFAGESNVGRFVVDEVLSQSEIIIKGNTVDVRKQLLADDFNKFYINEKEPYVGYKRISLIATNPANLNAKNVVFDTANQFEKINQIGGLTMSAIGKASYPNSSISGIDSYKFHTGLIAEANRIVYGDPRDSTTYPGVGAAGAEIFIREPLFRRIQVSIDVRIKTGVPFSTITEEVRNSVAALIQANPIGQPIPISDIVSNAAAIIGIQSVAISSPQYDPQNDIIRINSGEKSLVLDALSDIIVSKID